MHRGYLQVHGGTPACEHCTAPATSAGNQPSACAGCSMPICMRWLQHANMRRVPNCCRVSAVDGSRVDALVSGSYDGMLRVWTGKPPPILTISSYTCDLARQFQPPLLCSSPMAAQVHTRKEHL